MGEKAADCDFWIAIKLSSSDEATCLAHSSSVEQSNIIQHGFARSGH